MDAGSLYTSVPTELVNDIIRSKWNQLQDHTELPLSEFLNALKMTLDSTYFEFNHKFYKQISGCSMGLPIVAVLIQLLVEDLMESIIMMRGTI